MNHVVLQGSRSGVAAVPDHAKRPCGWMDGAAVVLSCPGVIALDRLRGVAEHDFEQESFVMLILQLPVACWSCELRI